MGIIKEYVDRAIQTGSDCSTSSSPFPYSDPAIVLVATGASTHPLRIPLPASPRDSSEDHTSLHPPYLCQTEIAYSHSIPPGSPARPLFAPLISRRLPKSRKQGLGLQVRRPRGETATSVGPRRIVSMPENQEESRTPSPSTHRDHDHDPGTRVVSMPDRVRSVQEPSVDLELFASPSSGTGDSFGSYIGRRQRIQVLHAHSDVPQTPSPPSSPDSLLIIDAVTQFPEGFLRRKYTPEPFPEEDEDWVAWANSPPRPIPALHGPLSLPYARCPSGAEGTIIEETDNVSRMIWGLGPDDQPPNQSRVEVNPVGAEAPHKLAPQGQIPVPPRMQRRKNPPRYQAGNQSQTPAPVNKSYPKAHSFTRTHQRPSPAPTDERSSVPTNQGYPGTDTREDPIFGLPWTEGVSTSSDLNGRDLRANNANVPIVDNERILEWQLALLRQALRNPSIGGDAYSSYPGGLEPVIPRKAVPGLPQPFPRIFVEPRANESVPPARRQSAVEIAQQYRQQQIYQQALQHKKLQQQSLLPTPPNSSSPQWSSHFSPYRGPTLSPDVAVSPDFPNPFTSQNPKYRSSTDSSQYFRRFAHERQDVFNHASTIDAHSHSRLPSTHSPQFTQNIKSTSTANIRQNITSSSTLAKYLQHLQALSPTTFQSPLQPGPPPNVPLPPIPSPSLQNIATTRGLAGHFSTNTSQSPAAPTPPSPESPEARPRTVSYQHPRSVPLARLMQRRLSSVPEEDSGILDSSASPSRLLVNRSQTDGGERQRSVSAHAREDMRTDGRYQHQAQYLEVPTASLVQPEAQAHYPRTPSPGSEGFVGGSDYGTPSSVFQHGTSPAKVRLPAVKEQEDVGHAQGQQVQHRGGDYHGQNQSRPRGECHNHHGYKKKYRQKKFRGSASSAGRVQAGGLVG